MIAANRAGKFLHGLEERGLRLGRRAVDFVGQQNISKDRARHECPSPVAGRGILFDDVRSGDVRGHQVRRKLDAAKDQAECLGDGANHQGLGGAREPGNQTMAADEQGRENLIQHVLLTNDDLANLSQNIVTDGLETFDAPFQFYGVQIQFGECGHCSFSFRGVLKL